MTDISIQPFKASDERERRIEAVFAEVLAESDEAKDLMFDGAWESQVLGQVLINTDAHPLAGVVPRDVFVTSFPAFNAFFERPGTFEFWLEIFRAVYGESVEIEFEIPSPGVLHINVLGGIEIHDDVALVREIVDDVYQYEPLVTHDGEEILFRSPMGLHTQTTIDNLVRELAVAGISTHCNLLVGGEE